MSDFLNKNVVRPVAIASATVLIALGGSACSASSAKSGSVVPSIVASGATTTSAHSDTDPLYSNDVSATDSEYPGCAVQWVGWDVVPKGQTLPVTDIHSGLAVDDASLGKNPGYTHSKVSKVGGVAFSVHFNSAGDNMSVTANGKTAGISKAKQERLLSGQSIIASSVPAAKKPWKYAVLEARRVTEYSDGYQIMAGKYIVDCTSNDYSTPQKAEENITNTYRLDRDLIRRSGICSVSGPNTESVEIHRPDGASIVITDGSDNVSYIELISPDNSSVTISSDGVSDSARKIGTDKKTPDTLRKYSEKIKRVITSCIS